MHQSQGTHPFIFSTLTPEAWQPHSSWVLQPLSPSHIGTSWGIHIYNPIPQSSLPHPVGEGSKPHPLCASQPMSPEHLICSAAIQCIPMMHYIPIPWGIHQNPLPCGITSTSSDFYFCRGGGDSPQHRHQPTLISKRVGSLKSPNRTARQLSSPVHGWCGKRRSPKVQPSTRPGIKPFHNWS